MSLKILSSNLNLRAKANLNTKFSSKTTQNLMNSTIQSQSMQYFRKQSI